MKKTVIHISIICVLLFAAAMTLTACLSESDNNDNKNTETEYTTTEITEDEKIDLDTLIAEQNKIINDAYANMTEEQQRELEEFKKNTPGGHRYWRQEMVIVGVIGPSDPRMDLETVKSIIASCNNYEDLKEKFTVYIVSNMIFPDDISGSGIGRNAYWLNETGSERIVFTNPVSHISYTVKYDDGTSYSEDLFDGTFEK